MTPALARPALLRPIFPAPLQSLLDRLYAEAVRTDPGLRQAARDRGLSHDGQPDFYAAMAEAAMPVTPDFGALLYILARSSGARHVVEFGTSFGLSTLCLAAAMRENGGGRIVTTEFLSEKANRARAHFIEAGLDDLIELRVGDARETLARDLPDPVDLLLLDAAKDAYGDVLRLVEKRFRPGSLVVSDRADLDGDDGGRAADYLATIRDPANGYRMAEIVTSALGLRFSHDLAVRL
ncbi:class I SAM-dependent methyltransferase [Methylobacterium currus]|uniref:O-methyltransferase n=1 Tax=Methylobacterium currus TaxID=2051553 RepID=UPI001E38A7E0|nr:class I SAM-dependent methyltransferase [Methylobacterium currus]UHC16361.1 class I SAM-dependent methyltransferase [Methylobacterium currus]